MSLQHNKRYIQLAFNKDLSQVRQVLPRVPFDSRIIVEAGTPFIKREGMQGVRMIRRLWRGPVIADLKITDGAWQEVSFAASAGANAVTVMGNAPLPTLNKFLTACRARRVYSMIDMLGIKRPLRYLLPMNSKPDAVVIHKGRDEESNDRAVIRYKDIAKIRSKYDSFISVAGGLVPTRVRTAFFNGADIAILNIIDQDDPNAGIPAFGNIPNIIANVLKEVGK